MLDFDDLIGGVELKWKIEKHYIERVVRRLLNLSGGRHRLTEIDVKILRLLAESAKNVYQLYMMLSQGFRTSYFHVNYSAKKLYKGLFIEPYHKKGIRSGRSNRKPKYFCLSVFGMVTLILKQSSFEDSLALLEIIVSSYDNLSLPTGIYLPLSKTARAGVGYHEVLRLKLLYTLCEVCELLRKSYHKPTYNRYQPKTYEDFLFAARPDFYRFTIMRIYEELKARKFWELFCRPSGPFNISLWSDIVMIDPDMTKELHSYLSKKIENAESRISFYKSFLNKLGRLFELS